MLETFCVYLTIQGVRLSNAAGRGESLKCYETETFKLSGVEFQTLLLFTNHVFSFFLSSLSFQCYYKEHGLSWSAHYTGCMYALTLCW